MKKIQKKTKGISSILGTVIVLAITIALGALLYAYANGMFSNLTQNANVNAQAQIIVNPSTDQAYLQYSLINNGNLQVNITSIEIDNQPIKSVNIVLNPGETYQNITMLTTTANPSITFQAGSYYTVIFIGHTATGKPFSIALNVLASETA